MRKLAIWIICTCLIGTALGEKPKEKPEPASEIQKYAEMYCGQWTVSGKSEESPRGPGGPWKGEISICSVLDGFAAVVNYASAPDRNLDNPNLKEWIWYDPGRESLAFISMGNEGVVITGTGSVGEVFEWEGIWDKGDVSYKFRAIDTHASNGKSFKREVSISEDGKNWLLWSKSRFVKAQEASLTAKEQKSMPKKVRKFFANLVGTWINDADKNVYMFDWAAGDSVLFAKDQTQDLSSRMSEIWYWDAVSKDGIIYNYSGLGGNEFAHGEVRGKIKSETLMEGVGHGITSSGSGSGNVRLELQGKNQFTMHITNISSADGEKIPDISSVYTRVKPTTRKDFEKYCKLNQGRWIGEVTWGTDRPGFGKKGEKVTAYYEGTVTQDGNALIEKFWGGDGTSINLTVYDAGTRQIKSMGTSSDGSTGIWIVSPKKGAWHSKGSEFMKDGTEATYVTILTYSDDGNQCTAKISALIDGEKMDDRLDVWRRISK